MYIKLASGKTAVVGRWPTGEELQEVDDAIRGLSVEQKIIVISDEDAPITKADLEKTENRILEYILEGR